MTDKTMTRRLFMGHAAVAVPVAAIFTSAGATAAAAPAGAPSLPKLELTDPVVRRTGGLADTVVDATKSPSYKAGHNCANCVQLQSGTGDWRPCNAFPGKLVSVKGWCSAWAQKPA